MVSTISIDNLGKYAFWVLLIIAFNINTQNAYSQKSTLCGYVKDSLTGEVIIGARISLADNSSYSITNNYGFFNIITEPNDQLIISFAGYKKALVYSKSADSCQTFLLNPTIKLQEVLVIRHKWESEFSGVINAPLKVIKAMPVIAGEKDLLKSLQTLPGIQGGVEGTSGMYVRGGSPDQNLVLIDGVPVYNINHLFGIFSVFNTDAINSATLYKGYIPAKFGGRISSVLDITMKEGTHDQLKGSLSIGLISSSLLLEDNIRNNKTSWLVSARRTYFDLIARPIIKEFAEGAIVGYYFHDINVKINNRINQKHRIYLSMYTGKDKYYYHYEDEGNYEDGSYFKEKTSDDLSWGNLTGAFRWNWLMNSKTFTNFTLTASSYMLGTNQFFDEEHIIDGDTSKTVYSIKTNSGIRDYSLKWDIEHTLSTFFRIESGIYASSQSYNPGSRGSLLKNSELIVNNDTSGKIASVNVEEFAYYIDSKINIVKAVILNTGIRAGFYFVEGEKYYGIEPRVHLYYSISRFTKLSLSYNRANQYLHLLTRSNMGLPNDIWVPSTKLIKPVYSNQYSIGCEVKTKIPVVFSSEIFYKQMENLTEYKEGASYLFNGLDWQNEVEQGHGKAYGIEFLAEKNMGKLSGWIAYTLSRSVRKFPTINKGQTFPYKYDRRHFFTTVVLYKPKDNIEIAATWLLSSGFRVTLITEKYSSILYDYKEYFPEIGRYGSVDHLETRNKYKTPSYHRLDLSISFHKKKNTI